jgi:transcription elongation factor GreA
MGRGQAEELSIATARTLPQASAAATLATVVLTEQEYEQLNSELAKLETDERRQIAEQIKEARAHGDISENAEYDAAKQAQALLENKIFQLREKIRSSTIATAPSGDGAQIGSQIEVEDQGSGGTRRLRLVGHLRPDGGSDQVSHSSPVGRALIGARPGQIVQIQAPSGSRSLKVVSVS